MAINYDRTNVKCSVQLFDCYGCRIRGSLCQKDAVGLLDRNSFQKAAHVW